jgi:hypothetical protein
MKRSATRGVDDDVQGRKKGDGLLGERFELILQKSFALGLLLFFFAAKKKKKSMHCRWGLRGRPERWVRISWKAQVATFESGRIHPDHSHAAEEP